VERLDARRHPDRDARHLGLLRHAVLPGSGDRLHRRTGGAGGASGAGLCVVSRGFALGASAKIDLSGGDGAPAASSTRSPTAPNTALPRGLGRRRRAWRAARAARRREPERDRHLRAELRRAERQDADPADRDQHGVGLHGRVRRRPAHLVLHRLGRRLDLRAALDVRRARREPRAVRAGEHHGTADASPTDLTPPTDLSRSRARTRCWAAASRRASRPPGRPRATRSSPGTTCSTRSRPTAAWISAPSAVGRTAASAVVASGHPAGHRLRRAHPLGRAACAR
jgi:hypothetical protein